MHRYASKFLWELVRKTLKMEKSNLDVSLNRIKSLAKECGVSLVYICRRLGVAKVYFIAIYLF